MISAGRSLDLSSVSIVVLSYNRFDVIRRNLADLATAVQNTNCELIVVDNASTDGSAQVIAEFANAHPDVKCIANNTNLGVAGGRNIGWLQASREFILSIDDDTLLSLEAAHGLLEFIKKKPKIGIVSPQIRHASTLGAQFYFDDIEYKPAGFHEACHMVRRSIIDTVGLYDESCSFGGEGLDLSVRTRAGGYEVAYFGDVTVLHENLIRSGAEGRYRRERWVYGFVRLHHKYFPWSVATRFSLRYLVSHLVSGMRAFGPLLAMRLLKAALRGYRDGRQARQQIPDAIVRFYSDPELRPEFGNAPIWRKLLQRMRRQSAAHGA